MYQMTQYKTVLHSIKRRGGVCSNQVTQCCWTGGVSVSGYMGAVWHSGSIRSNPTTLNGAHFLVIVEVICSI